MSNDEPDMVKQTHAQHVLCPVTNDQNITNMAHHQQKLMIKTL